MNFYFQLIIKSWKNYENLDFSTSGLCLAFKKFFGLFSIFLAFRYLEYSKSFKFELFWSNFAIKTFFAENLAKWISVSSSLEKSDLNRIFSRFLVHNLATASKTNRKQYCSKIRRSCQIEEVKSKFSTAHKEMNRIFVKFDTTPWLCMST